MAARFMALGSWLLVTMGCTPATSPTGASTVPDTATVSGTVTYKGKPVPGGTITFRDPHGHEENGKIQLDGTYNLTSRPGRNTVQVRSRDSDIPMPNKLGITAKAGTSLIPERYGVAGQADLSVEVRAGANQHNFDLKD